MRVLAISEHYFPIIGGSTNYVFNLCKSLSEIGCEVFLVTIPDDKNPVNEWYTEGAFHVYRLNIPRFLRKERYFPFIIAPKINKIIDEVRPDVIHFVHGFFAPLITRLNQDIKTKPIIWTIQNVPSYEDKLDYFRKIKPLHSLLEPIYLTVADAYGYLALKISRYDLLICVSRKTADAVHARNVPWEKIEIIPNGVDIEFFTSRIQIDPKKLGITGRRPLILTVAGLTPTKGLHFLVDSAKRVVDRYPTALFLIIGPVRSEEYYLGLKRKINSLDLEDNIKIITGVAQDVINKYFSICDVYVQPSLEEGFCMTVLEAMSAGKAVIGTITGAIPQLIKGSGGGILIEPGSSQQLSDTILELLADEEGREEMGSKGHKYVLKNFSWERIAEETLKLYYRVSRE